MITSCPGLSGFDIVGFAFQVTTHEIFMCCFPVMVGTWLAAIFRGMFGANQVPMGVAVTAAVFFLPALASFAGDWCFGVVHSLDEVFYLSIFCFDLVAELFHCVG